MLLLLRASRRHRRLFSAHRLPLCYLIISCGASGQRDGGGGGERAEGCVSVPSRSLSSHCYPCAWWCYGPREAASPPPPPLRWPWHCVSRLEASLALLSCLPVAQKPRKRSRDILFGAVRVRSGGSPRVTFWSCLLPPLPVPLTARLPGPVRTAGGRGGICKKGRVYILVSRASHAGHPRLSVCLSLV